MKIEIHQLQNCEVAEITSDIVLIHSALDALDILGNLYYQNINRIIIHQNNITTSFFDLRSGIAGEILQKFSNYRVRLAIVGDFTKYTSKSMNDFIYESNKAGHINFVPSVSEALIKLSNYN